MKKFLLIACSLQAALLSAQTFGWAVNHGSSGNDVPRDIATDAAGNVYTVGYFNGTVDFDPGAGSFPLTSLGGQDIFITKLDPSGNLLWAGRIGGAGNEQANGIALDASANMHITGCFYGTVDFDPGAGVFNSGNMTGADIYVLKLTSTGGFVWFKQMGGTNDNQQGNEIAVDAAGNVYSTGQSIGVIDFDPGPGTAQLGVAFSGNTNFYVSKLDINGLYVWAKVIGNSSSGVYGMDIAVNAAQEVYTCGYFIGTVDFDPGTGTFSSGSGSANNCFVHKYTSVGNFSFMKRVGTGNIQCEGYAMVKTASNIYVTGYSYGTSDLDPGTGTVNHISAGLQDVFILSLDNLGIYQWSKQIGGTGQDYGYSIATDALGAIYTTGTYEGTVDFDPGAGSSPLTSANVRDVFISKLQSNGNYAWGFSIGGTGIDVGQGIAVSPAGSVYTTGFKSGTGDYDPTAGTFNLAHGGGYDAFVQKMAQCLTPVAPPNTTAPAALIVCSNNSTTLTATGFGTLGWYSAPSGGTYLGGGSSFSTPALTSNTTYYVQDSLCAAGTRTTITVSVSPAMTPSLSSVIHVSCNGGTDGMATVGVTGGTPGFTYLWSPSGGTAATASSLAANSYTCTITDAAGCTTTQTVSITQPTAITSSVSSQTNILCNGANTGAATINASGGTGVLTYSWSPSGGTAASISGRTAGIYTCTITDANSCTHTQTVNITQPSAIVSSLSSQTNISCNGGSDGAATVSVTGGTPSYSYAWTPIGGNAATVTGLTAGTYSCTITDANSCTQIQTVFITEPTLLTAVLSGQTDPTCNAGNNGTADITAAGGTGILSYAWLPTGGNAATANGIGAGTYTCTVTDANGCTITATATLTEPTAIATSVLSQAGPACNGGSDGTATVDATGGTPSYTYSWAPTGGNAATGIGFPIGVFTCTITDANGCTQTQSVFITQPAAIASSQTVTLCAGQTLTVGATTYTVTGIYNEVLTAMNGCDSTVTTDLTISSTIDVTTTVAGNTATANQNGATYQWIDCLNGNAPVAGETNQSFTPSQSGDYAVIVTVGACSDTSACTNVITEIVANESNVFSVYPNPTSDNITIQLSHLFSDANIEIFNATGQIVSSEKPVSNLVTVTLPEENGMYLVRITMNGVSYTTRIVKQ